MAHPDDPPDEFLAAIGKVAIRWNRFEQILNLLLIHMLGKNVMEDRSHIVFAHMAFPQKLDIFGALAEALINGGYPWVDEQRTKIIPALKDAQARRNKIIHSVWGMKSGKVVSSSISARGSLKVSWTDRKMEDLNGAIQSIEDAEKLLEKMAWLFGKYANHLRSRGKN